MTILIKNGRVINPATDMDEVADVYIEDGKVSGIETDSDWKADEVIDAEHRGSPLDPGAAQTHGNGHQGAAGDGKKQMKHRNVSPSFVCAILSEGQVLVKSRRSW